jgi:hypothetical protein
LNGGCHLEEFPRNPRGRIVEMQRISFKVAGTLLAAKSGDLVPLLDDEAQWFASPDEVVLGAVLKTAGGKWRYALLVRDPRGQYQKFSVDDGYATATQARSALFNQSQHRPA